jgi:predicted RecB family nuclease
VWSEHCEEVAGPDDPSFRIEHGRLRVREWQFLASHGVRSLGELAALEPSDAFLDEFALQAASRTGRASAEKFMRTAIERARMFRDDIAFELRGDPPVVPSADVEIDFDIEWDRGQRIYQWGLRVRENQDETTARYVPLVSFDALDDEDEAALADAFADQLGAIVESAANAGRSVRIYHWSSVEISRTRGFPRVEALLAEHAFDLMAWFEEHYRVRGSYSIKSVATAFGFAWGVDDAGGFTSMDRIETARGAGPDAEAAKEWCLDYNAADVEAQAVIRDGCQAMVAISGA